MFRRICFCFWLFQSFAIYSAEETIASKEEPFRFTVVHTNDLHSHFEGLGPDHYFTQTVGDDDPVKGHYARLAHEIKKIQNEKRSLEEPVLTVDAGDWFSGTMFNILGPSDTVDSIPELEFFDYTSYDAVTIGNHEFDVDAVGLGTMFQKADAKKLKIPFVASNIRFKEGSEKVAKFFSNDSLLTEPKGITITPYIIKTFKSKGREFKIGIMGSMGPNACLVSAGTRKAFAFGAFDDTKSKELWSQWVEETRRSVIQLKREFEVDIVLLLLHGGKPEDIYLQERIPEIDIIIAGHTLEHYGYKKGNAIMAHTGCCGEFLGVMELEFAKGKGVDIRKIEQIEMNDAIPADEGMLQLIEKYKGDISKVYRSPHYKYSTVITQIDRDLMRIEEPNSTYGRWVINGILKEMNKLGYDIDVYVSNINLLRASLMTANGKSTDVQFSDIFRILSLGFDKDKHPGSPIVTYYVTKSEMWTMLEAYELYTDWIGSYFPLWSDTLKFEKWFWGIPGFNRLNKVTLHGLEYEQWPPLIHVASSEYLANYWDKMTQLTLGLATIKIRDKEGNPITKPLTHPNLPKEYELFANFLREKPALPL